MLTPAAERGERGEERLEEEKKGERSRHGNRAAINRTTKRNNTIPQNKIEQKQSNKWDQKAKERI